MVFVVMGVSGLLLGPSLVLDSVCGHCNPEGLLMKFFSPIGDLDLSPFHSCLGFIFKSRMLIVLVLWCTFLSLSLMPVSLPSSDSVVFVKSPAFPCSAATYGDVPRVPLCFAFWRLVSCLAQHIHMSGGSSSRYYSLDVCYRISASSSDMPYMQTS